MSFRNPLQWPVGQPRTAKRHKAPFKAGNTKIIDDLDRAVKKLGITNITISTDRRVRVDGQLSMSSGDNAADPGIAVYFTRKGEELCIAFDKFTDIWGNLRAVGLYLEYMARLEAYDMTEMADKSFTAYKALPSSVIVPPAPQAWYDVLQVNPQADADIVQGAYRKLILRYHPDNQNTGNEQMFHKVQAAWKESPHGK